MSVECVKWLGRCDHCGEPAPEERDSFEAAQQDAEECPCRDEPEEAES